MWHNQLEGRSICWNTVDRNSRLWQMPDQLTCSPGGYNTPNNPFNGPLSRTTSLIYSPSLWVQYLQFPPLITVHKILSPQPQTMFSLVYFYILHLHFVIYAVFTGYTHNNNHFTTLCPGPPGWAGTRRNIHPPTILITQSLSASSIYHNP